ncbi:type II toxin-antitoxin system RelE/ParE family toxin [Glutamicibacter sp. BW77]|uniref:Type II toxin-antitoxin system RelE/ParE family toxin n=1 Tax=Glutamicibacter bergerei TaxID=256702 RepID=A0ABV9MR69_9MICC|nr:type II toxin-antitoxin system RelE/ParE family toxin [Glutamicibacter sp. BW77]PCC33260.1 plasmid stabilization protein [Glutamicibacter sp. BW77]HBV10588.1 type II toxin-antitoxin system RelE/ParE family toxin [Micrococcaceae bacterium]
MSSYRVEFTTAAAKELKKLDSGIRRRILSGIAELEQDPRPAECKKLAGETNAWWIRVGDYRVFYEVIDNILVVTVVRVAHRREVYK